MDWWKPIGGLVGLFVLLVAVGAVVTLGAQPLSLGATPPFDHQQAALVTVLLVVVLVVVGVVLGARSGRWLSNPYW